jgi:glycosyltransferase involved in cell wall biosynthesis
MASSQPLVSVIVPTFNRPDTLAETLDSLIAQTYPHFEVLVINDGGCDVSHVIQGRDAQNRIRYLQRSTNRGPNTCRNEGIRASSGQYIAYLDDDDCYYPNHLATLVAVFEQSPSRVAYSDAFEAQNLWTGDHRITMLRELAYSCDFDADRLALWSFIPTLCIMHHRSCLDEVGHFDESLSRCEDWEMWLRMSRHFPFAHTRQATCEFSTILNGFSLRSQGLLPHLEGTVSIRRKHMDWINDTKHADLFYPLMLKQLISLWWSRGNDEAISFLENMVAWEPDNPVLLTDLASFYLHRGYPQKATSLLEDTAGRFPDYWPTWVTLAEAYAGLGRLDEAKSLQARALEADPCDWRAQDLSLVLGGNGASRRNGPGNGLHSRRTEAPKSVMNDLPEARIFLDRYPGDDFVAETLTFIQPKPWREVAVSRNLETEVEMWGDERSLNAELLLWLSYTRRRQPEKIGAVCERIVNKFESSDWFPEWKGSVRVFYNFASRLHDCGDMARAYRLFYRIAESLRKRGGLPNELGGSYFHLGQLAFINENLEESRFWLEACLEQIHDHRKARSYLAEIERRTGQR